MIRERKKKRLAEIIIIMPTNTLNENRFIPMEFFFSSLVVNNNNAMSADQIAWNKKKRKKAVFKWKTWFFFLTVSLCCCIGIAKLRQSPPTHIHKTMHQRYFWIARCVPCKWTRDDFSTTFHLSCTLLLFAILFLFFFFFIFAHTVSQNYCITFDISIILHLHILANGTLYYIPAYM